MILTDARTALVEGGGNIFGAILSTKNPIWNGLGLSPVSSVICRGYLRATGKSQVTCLCQHYINLKKKVKVFPLQARCGPEGG